MRTSAIAAIAELLLFTVTTAIPVPKADKKPPAESVADLIEGYYAVAGDVKGKPYDGVCQIKKAKDIYIVRWNVDSGPMAGIGILEEGILSVGWIMGEKMHGITVYKLADGELRGWWTMVPGDGRKYKENLKRLK